jgi:outer membrane protein TolC
VILALAVLVQVAAGDSLPRVTLAEALQRSARLDPSYVAALGRVDNAEWGRRAALTAFVLPSITVSADVSRASPASFSIGTFQLEKTSSSATIAARMDLFTGGQKIQGLRFARAQLEAARASEVQFRFITALLTEADYYAALSDEELARVAAERVRRAEEQLATARARVLSGAAVQTDSLQLLLELTRARVAMVRQNATLRTSRLQLGRRVGLDGPARPAPLDSAAARALPFALDDAVRRALSEGPDYRIARANERAADAQLWSRRGSYLPRATFTAIGSAFGVSFYPDALRRTQFTLGVSLPIWDGAQREIALSQARVNRDVARAIRQDLERAARRDVSEAYDAYETARAEADLAGDAIVVARENFRVQDTRYRSGATTILDLVDAQLSLTEAEANMVLARYSTRLALAALEAVLGQRLFDAQGTP